jgi:leader peptidase (prepilin peptidase)/N-methyltransferase
MATLALQIPLLAMLAASLPLAIIDIREHRLPNPSTYSLSAISFLGTALASFASSDWERWLIASGLNLGITAIGVLLYLLKGFGLGDVKLLFAINQILGYFSPWLVLVSLTIALLTSAGFSLAGVLMGKLKWKDRIAFGPFLILGYAVLAVPLVVTPTLY